MASFKCICGHVFSLNQSPGGQQFAILSQDRIDTMLDEILTEVKKELPLRPIGVSIGEIFVKYANGPIAIQCPQCARLHVFRKYASFESPDIIFEPMNNGRQKVAAMNELG